jgi:hypothetical protein
MKLNAQQHFEQLNLYGLVQGMSYVVRLNDLKTAQHLRVRLALVLRHPGGLAKPLQAELKELFAISGVWIRNVGDRHDTKRKIQQLIRRIVPRLKVTVKMRHGKQKCGPCSHQSKPGPRV